MVDDELNQADGAGQRPVKLGELVTLLDGRVVTRSNIAKVQIFHFKGEKVSEWLELLEQITNEMTEEEKFHQISKYVWWEMRPEVMRVAADAAGNWGNFKAEMQRRYQLGDRLLTTEDLERLERSDFTTVGAFVTVFEKMARKVPGLAEESQCAIFLSNFTKCKSVSLTRRGAIERKLTWETVKQSLVDEELNQVLTVTQPQAKAAKKVVEQVEDDDDDEGEEVAKLTKSQRKARNQAAGGQGSKKGAGVQAVALAQVNTNQASTSGAPPQGPAPLGPWPGPLPPVWPGYSPYDLWPFYNQPGPPIGGPTAHVAEGYPTAPTQGVNCKEGANSSSKHPRLMSTSLVKRRVRDKVKTKEVTGRTVRDEAVEAADEVTVTADKAVKETNAEATGMDKVEMTGQGKEDEEDERLRKEEEEQAAQRAKKRKPENRPERAGKGEGSRKQKYAVPLEDGLDIEALVDRLLEGHNDLLNLKDILIFAPKLREGFKTRCSRRRMASVRLGDLIPVEAHWAVPGMKMDWKSVRIVSVNLSIKGKPCSGMLDTGAEMNIIKESDALRLGMDIDRMDSGFLYGANGKTHFTGTASNVVIEIGKAKVWILGLDFAQMTERIRGTGSYEERVAQIVRESLDWRQFARRMLRLWPQPIDRQGRTMCFDGVNLDEFLEAFLIFGDGQRWTEAQRVKQTWAELIATLREAFAAGRRRRLHREVRDYIPELRTRPRVQLEGVEGDERRSRECRRESEQLGIPRRPRTGKRRGRQGRGDSLEERDQVLAMDTGGVLPTDDVGEGALPIESQRYDSDDLPAREIRTLPISETCPIETGIRGCDPGVAHEAPILTHDGEEVSLQFVLTTASNWPTRIDTTERVVSDAASEDRRDRPYRWRDTRDMALDPPQGELQLTIGPATMVTMQEHEGRDLTPARVVESDPQCHSVDTWGPDDRRRMREDTLRDVIWPRYEQRQRELELIAASRQPQAKVLAHRDGAYEGPQTEQAREVTPMYGELRHDGQEDQPQSEPAMEDGERGAIGPSSLDGLPLLSESQLAERPNESKGSLTAQLYDMESPRMQTLRVGSSPLDFGDTPRRDGDRSEAGMRGFVEAGPERTQGASMTHEEESLPESRRSVDHELGRRDSWLAEETGRMPSLHFPGWLAFERLGQTARPHLPEDRTIGGVRVLYDDLTMQRTYIGGGLAATREAIEQTLEEAEAVLRIQEREVSDWRAQVQRVLREYEPPTNATDRNRLELRVVLETVRSSQLESQVSTLIRLRHETEEQTQRLFYEDAATTRWQEEVRMRRRTGEEPMPEGERTQVEEGLQVRLLFGASVRELAGVMEHVRRVTQTEVVRGEVLHDAVQRIGVLEQENKGLRDMVRDLVASAEQARQSTSRLEQRITDLEEGPRRQATTDLVDERRTEGQQIPIGYAQVTHEVEPRGVRLDIPRRDSQTEGPLGAMGMTCEEAAVVDKLMLEPNEIERRREGEARGLDWVPPSELAV
ncbi:hypothetical protein CBR_g40205 [Chara braunii]|uniref:Peptidase A2 domain-containing protein n=1 Tax=Chara braunii TaxID=69332 RepID=A0A388LTD1_CHABU|nr:hypothetical protein CBR_g40205 [Chara braunii]|eukprot:GBG85567.1 hypothetical protein CBR_g40205 [Chara braunii]